ncbi:hypothetical protein [Nocardiopsis sp. HUAS JQ3]|uniref:hypothetical protein n=1 Tax=Nocardiopsis sp. HUAS JQ3 TaxID=3061629 RepID=UPI0023A9496E|nr:hypothetical protein [Nocardiopsis sp. HUAS JQ3]WDZ91278.1 hypothetical protein PV789_01510 [Nocardiopsis sp. HUAS JQ3]
MFVSKPGSRQQERLRAYIENPRRRRFWAARSRRRLTVVAFALVTVLAAASYAVGLMAEASDSYVSLTLYGLLLGGSALLATHVNVAVRWVGGYEGLDEFQRAEMDHAARVGHNVTMVLLCVLLVVGAIFGSWVSNLELSARLLMAVLVPLVVLTTMCHAAFPACYLAWIRPDEVLDDEDDEDA